MLTKILEAIPSLSAPAFRWREVLGSEDYEVFAFKWLIQTESHIESYHCRDCGDSHRVIYHSKTDIVSVPPPESHCDKKVIHCEDIRILEFDVSALGSALCLEFDIKEDQAVIGKGAVLRLGWIGQAQRQYPVYLLLRNPQQAEVVAQSLLLEEEQPFVLFSGVNIPSLHSQLKKKKCVMFCLEREARLSSKGITTILTGQELFSGFLRGAEGSAYTPPAGVQILGDYERIRFADGSTLNLKRAYKRRAVVRFIHKWVQQSCNPVFDIEVVREAYNRQGPKHDWTGDRIRDELFKRDKADFDRIFVLEDAANGRYRLKI